MNDTTRAHATLLRRWYLFIGLLLLVACGTPAAQSVAPPSVASPTPDATATPVPSPLPTPTPVPTATPEPRLAEGVYIAGIEVGGLTPTEARRELTARLAPLLRPLDIRAGDQELLLRVEDIDMRLDLDAMIDAARAASAGERIPLQVVYDEAKLRKALATLNEQASTPAQFSIITGTTAMSRSFVMEGGLVIDIE
jgi:hypothetical protein